MTPTEFYSAGLTRILVAVDAGGYMSNPKLDINRLDADLEKLRQATIALIHEQAAEGGD